MANEKWFTFGGVGGGANTNAIYKFDLATETWSTSGTTLSQAKFGMATPEMIATTGVRHVGIFNGSGATWPIDEAHTFNTSTEVLTARGTDPGAGNRLAGLPGHAAGSKGFMIGGEITGSFCSNENYEFDINTLAWTTKTTLFHWHKYHTIMRSTNNMYHYLDGRMATVANNTGNPDNNNYRVEVNSQTIYRATDAATTYMHRRSIEGPSIGTGAGVKDYAYVCGGYYSAADKSQRTDKYRFSNDTWTNLANMPEWIYYGAIFKTLNELYLYYAGGYAAAGAMASVTKYDITGNSWSTLSAGSNIPVTLYAAGFASDWLTPAWTPPYVPLYQVVAYKQSNVDYAIYNATNPTGLDIYGTSLYKNPYWNASKLSVYSRSTGTFYIAMRKTTDDHLVILRTADAGDTWALEYELVRDNDNSNLVSIDISGNTLYVLHSTSSADPDHGTFLAKINLTTHALISDVKLTTVSGLSLGSVAVDKDNSLRILVNYSNNWKYSEDGGATWSAEATFNTTKPTGGEAYDYEFIYIITHYNTVNNRIEFIGSNNATGSKDTYQLYWDWTAHKFIYVQKMNWGAADLIDACVDQDWGSIYIARCWNWPTMYFTRYQLKYNTWAITSMGYFWTHGDSSTGSPKIACAYTVDHSVVFGIQYLDGTTDNYPLIYNIAFDPGDDGENTFDDYDNWLSYWNSYTFTCGTSKIAFTHEFLFFNIQDDNGLANIPLGPATVVFFNFIDKSTRTPLIGATVELKDSTTGGLYMTLSEHPQYGGLYYGTLPAGLSTKKLDIYVNTVKITQVSSIVLVPSEYWPVYKSQH